MDYRDDSLFDDILIKYKQFIHEHSDKVFTMIIEFLRGSNPDLKRTVNKK